MVHHFHYGNRLSVTTLTICSRTSILIGFSLTFLCFTITNMTYCQSVKDGLNFILGGSFFIFICHLSCFFFFFPLSSSSPLSYFFIKYLNSYYVWGIIPGARDASVTETDKNLCLQWIVGSSLHDI